MLDFMIIAVPLVSAVLAAGAEDKGLRRLLLPVTAIVHFVLTLLLLSGVFPQKDLFSWICFDDIGKLFLTLISNLYLAASAYGYNYLRQHEKEAEKLKEHQDKNAEGISIPCMLVFLSTMSLVAGSCHAGLLWVGIEATTLASAPLIYYNKNRYSLEAAWKYLLICSVGIGLALIGNIFLELSFPASAEGSGLTISGLIINASALNPKWLEIAFIFFFIGYGTKMGLAPMHTWLPDAHSEAPSMISALMSGALLICGFLGILRIYQVLIAAGLDGYGRGLFLVFGLISVFIAAVFVIGQADYKRMLAYSSIENMGIAAVGIGLGGEAVYGSLLHVINHSFTKGALFLVAGNILAIYHTRRIDSVSGVLKAAPVSGVLWLAMFLAISGIPPFGMFVSEFLIVREAIISGSYASAIILVFMLVAVFAGMSAIFIKTACGNVPDKNVLVTGKEAPVTYIPSIILGALTFCLGICIPGWLDIFLKTISSALR